MAINDKTMHPAIKRLSFKIQIMLIFLILIAVIEYFIIYKQIFDTKANFRLIEKANSRTAELHKIAKKFPLYDPDISGHSQELCLYATREEFTSAINAEFGASLDLIYKIKI